ncbi:flagellar hook-basal body complex protein FliE [Candidatus Thorarchaeota archaeon]|nr:MAG: flagellar hook-basal body complex protein FliE [Candidatus Thorarchaeota archaeon]
MKIIIITGMPGAGKSEVAKQFKQSGLPIVIMGDVIRLEVKKRGMKATPKNTKKVMLELRAVDGPAAVAERCINQLEKIDSDTVIIEGCRSIPEMNRFREFSNDVITVAVHSSPITRFTRLQSRNRKDAPEKWEVFRERDLREISVGIGGVIALSDHMIVNESSIEELRRITLKVMESVL